MKKMKKIFALLIAMVMVLGMSTSVFAQTVGGGTQADGKGQIIISNAAKGEKYKVVKLFDASVTGTQDGSIAYTGTIPEALSAYFEKDSAGNIKLKAAGGTADAMSDELNAALKAWAGSADDGTESDGSVLYFNNLDYGYYVVVTSHEDDTAKAAKITVTSTNPTATIFDKNSTSPTIPSDGGKKVDDAVVSIGDTINYTFTFTATNFEGSGKDAKRVLSYILTDTLPEFLSDVTVTSIKVDGKPITTQQFDKDGKITIAWVSDNETDGYTSLYDNNVTVELAYSAKVNDKIAAGEVVTNKNKITLSWTVEGDSTPQGGDEYTSETTIKTAAAAIQKVDENGANLPGAKFSIKGLTVTGSEGNYTVVSYNKSEDATAGTEMEADGNGLIVIRGIASDETLVATETVAPDGYNKLEGTTNVTPKLTSTTTTVTTTYVDEDGHVVDTKTEDTTTVVTTNDDLKAAAAKIENQKGATLPSTGGIGTTIFYVIGAILVIGAGVVLVTRRRMNVQ